MEQKCIAYMKNSGSRFVLSKSLSPEPFIPATGLLLNILSYGPNLDNYHHHLGTRTPDTYPQSLFALHGDDGDVTAGSVGWRLGRGPRQCGTDGRTKVAKLVRAWRRALSKQH